MFNLSFFLQHYFNTLFVFFINDLYLLIPAVIAQSFIPTAELVMPTGRQTNEANAEIETQIVIAKVSKCLT